MTELQKEIGVLKIAVDKIEMELTKTKQDFEHYKAMEAIRNKK